MENNNRDSNQGREAGQVVYGDEIDLRELFLVIWAGKWIVLVGTAIATLIAVVIALSLPNVYRSEALLAPASGEENSGLGSLASQYGGLASLAGINLGGLGGGSSDKTTFGMEVLKSRKFIGDFVSKRQLLPSVMALEDWNLPGNELVFDDSIYDSETNTWTRNVDPPKQAEPSLLEAHEEFLELLDISQDADTGLVKLSVATYSPYLSKQWVDWLVEDINAEIRLQEVSEAEKSIAFLQNQLNATSLADMQTIFYQLIEEQTQTIMLANARPEYLFRTVDPAVVAEEPTGPRRPLIALVGMLLGGFLSLLFVLCRHFFSTKG